MNKKFYNKNCNIALIIFLSALFVRVIFSVYSYYLGIQEKFLDDKLYFEIAKLISKDGIFYLNEKNWDELTNAIGPFVPFYLFIVRSLFGENWLILFLINSIISSLIPVIIYFLSYKLFNIRTAITSAIFSIFYILYIKQTASSGKELWITFLFLVSVYYLMVMIKDKGIKLTRVFLFSSAFSLLIHTDERYFAYFPLFLMIILISNNSNKLKYGFVFIGITVLFSIPWNLRNYLAFDNLVLFTTRTTKITEKFIDYNYKNRFLINDNHLEFKPPLKFTNELKDSVLQGKLTQFDRRITKEQIEEIKSGNYPKTFSTIELWFSNFIMLWKPIDFINGYSGNGWRFDGKWSLKHNFSIGLTYGVVLIFSIYGFYLLFVNRKYFILLFTAILFYHTFIHLLFIPYTRNRYRVPIDFIIIIVGSFALSFLIEKFLTSKKNKDGNKE